MAHTDVIELGALLAAMPAIPAAQSCPLLASRASSSDTLWSVFDSSGVAVQDIAIAKLVSQLIDKTGV